MRFLTKYAAAEAAIIVCALRFDDGVGDRNNLLRGALGGNLMREIGSRGMEYAVQLGREHSTRGGSELHLP